jgi:hypothetical protein
MDAALAALLSPSRRRTTFSGARISSRWELGIGTGIFLLCFPPQIFFQNRTFLFGTEKNKKEKNNEDFSRFLFLPDHSEGSTMVMRYERNLNNLDFSTQLVLLISRGQWG